ncbi:MAG: flagellar protein FliS [Lachnospiraceae bacterium]|nr:flagellar protein FliS [Lachnospiraceae bacterium]
MQKEKIQEYTRRISQDNRSELIVTMYDIMSTYFEDAEAAFHVDENEAFKANIRNVDKVLVQLMESLNFKYKPADTLYALYVYCREELAKSMMKHDLDGLYHAKKVLSGLREGFAEAAKKDTSAPLMRNTQQVYAGITYGKNDINENYTESDNKRGFLV